MAIISINPSEFVVLFTNWTLFRTGAHRAMQSMLPSGRHRENPSKEPVEPVDCINSWGDRDVAASSLNHQQVAAEAGW